MVSVMNVRPDPSIAVGTPVLAASSKLGTAVDVAAVEEQALAAHASDGGNNVSISVYPSRRLAPLEPGALRILFVGDVVGRPGRDAVEGLLPGLRDRLDVDACVVNGENVANGVGITPRLAERLMAAGADAITLG